MNAPSAAAGVARACVRCAAAGVLHLPGIFSQPDLVRRGGMALLLRHTGVSYAKADGRGAEYAVLPHQRAVLCVRGYHLWTVGCFWPETSPASPTFWCDMLLTLAILGLPATKGGGCMTTIENIFICMGVTTAAGGRFVHGQAAASLLPVLHCRDGECVPAFPAHLQPTFLAAVCPGGRPCRHEPEIAPVVEK